MLLDFFGIRALIVGMIRAVMPQCSLILFLSFSEQCPSADTSFMEWHYDFCNYFVSKVPNRSLFFFLFVKTDKSGRSDKVMKTQFLSFVQCSAERCHWLLTLEPDLMPREIFFFFFLNLELASMVICFHIGFFFLLWFWVNIGCTEQCVFAEAYHQR